MYLPPHDAQVDEVVVELPIAVAEDALPRHEDVVEDGEGVHLVEAAGEGLVVEGAARVEALAADEAEAFRRNGDGEAEGVHLLLLAAQGAVGRDEELVREGREGGEELGAAQDDALRGGVDDADGDVGVGLLADGGAPVHLRVAEAMGERQVVVADVGVVVDEVLGEHPLIAAVLLGHLAGGGHLNVDVVGRAAEDAVVGVGDDLEGAAAAQQVLLAVGDDE